MACTEFSYNDFYSLVSHTIGIFERLDNKELEQLTILYCDFSDYSSENISKCLRQIPRDADAMAHYDKYFFFVLPLTDQYGAVTLAEMIEEFFDHSIPYSMVSYPLDGENAQDILSELQLKIKKSFKKSLECLYPDILQKVHSDAI